MTVVWIVTTGNNNVKLKSDHGWGDLRRRKNEQLKPCNKEFSSLIKGDDKLFSLPARAMGILYGDTWDTHKDYFSFPLLEEFAKKLKSENKNPDHIIVLLTNQEKIFLEDSDDPQYDRFEDSPYWRDTSRLEVIFRKYFDREFGEGRVQFTFPVLEPRTREEGLDNWDSTLDLVQKEFDKWQISKDDIVIVSHQASTPAISSAVQFVSLAKFGEKAIFLIGNEQDSTLTRFLEGSKYLKGIRKKEAEALLISYNYAGVEALLKDNLENNEDAKILLNAAIQWNVAKFGDFLKCLEDYPKLASDIEERKRAENWWWIAYEEVYLAIIRKNQGNIIEAFFHSFRAFEGIFAAWGYKNFGQHIENIEGVPYLSPSILDDAKGYFSNLSGKGSKKAVKDIKSKLENLKSKREGVEAKVERNDRVKLDLQVLCKLFKAFRYSDYVQNCPELRIFWDDNKLNNVSEKRNFVIHQVQGMSKSDLWNSWGIFSMEGSDEAEDKLWEDKLLKFLNFIVKEDFSEGFKLLKDASLMAKVHKELVSVFDKL